MSKIDQISKVGGAVSLVVLTDSETVFALDGGILDEIRAAELRDMVAIQAELKAVIDNYEDAVTHIRKVYDLIRQDMVPSKMDELGITNIKYDGIGKVTLQGDINASIKSDMKPDAYQWLDDNGHGDLITQTVNSSSLKSLLKKKLKEGEEVPEELFNVNLFTRAQITRG